ncbi:MAG: spore coat associated protein CotJA [Bacillota bacterium]|nr:spore coat associated protein CotJA [Bacillota bacterium]
MNCKTTSREGYCQNRNSFDFDYLMDEIDNAMQHDIGRGCRSHMEKCDFDTWTLAMAYVPMQPWEETYDLEKGLNSGTVFPSLYLPFLGGECR